MVNFKSSCFLRVLTYVNKDFLHEFPKINEGILLNNQGQFEVD